VTHKAPIHREVACAILIDTCGRLLLQQRDDIRGIVHPGKIGLFGGHREAGETSLECVTREIHEEISYSIPPTGFEYFTAYEAVEEEDGDMVHAEFFIARDLDVDLLTITEGSLLLISPDDLATVEPRLTPSARFAIRALLRCNEAREIAATKS
jgi:8-oxo-dGTP pyrophosphatase MutT (NUDIX family)